MIEQGVKINQWGKNVYVKVPVINSKKFYFLIYLIFLLKYFKSD